MNPLPPAGSGGASPEILFGFGAPLVELGRESPKERSKGYKIICGERKALVRAERTSAETLQWLLFRTRNNGLHDMENFHTEENSRMIRILQCWKSTGWQFLCLNFLPKTSCQQCALDRREPNPQSSPRLVPSGSAQQNHQNPGKAKEQQHTQSPNPIPPQGILLLRDYILH